MLAHNAASEPARLQACTLTPVQAYANVKRKCLFSMQQPGQSVKPRKSVLFYLLGCGFNLWSQRASHSLLAMTVHSVTHALTIAIARENPAAAAPLRPLQAYRQAPPVGTLHTILQEA